MTHTLWSESWPLPMERQCEAKTARTWNLSPSGSTIITLPRGSPPPNIMIRDYARGIIELALHRGMALTLEPKNIRPPYVSQWPESIPSREELEKAYGWHDQQNEEVRHAWYSIFDSVMGQGDFARYVIGTNWGTFHWLSVPLTKPRPKNTSRHHYSEQNLGLMSPLPCPRRALAHF